MRGRAGLGGLLVLLGLALAVLGQLAGEPWRMLGGLAFASGLVVLASLLGFWRRLGVRLPPMPDLAQRPGAGQRWCARCGRASPRKGPCPTCGVAAARERRRLRQAARVQQRLARRRQRMETKQAKRAK